MSEPTGGSPAAQDGASIGPLVYLDYNCFQRGFDDPAQVRIQMEALACQEVFARAARSEITLAWSFMHEARRSSVHFLPAGKRLFGWQHFARCA